MDGGSFKAAALAGRPGGGGSAGGIRSDSR